MISCPDCCAINEATVSNINEPILLPEGSFISVTIPIWLCNICRFSWRDFEAEQIIDHVIASRFKSKYSKEKILAAAILCNSVVHINKRHDLIFAQVRAIMPKGSLKGCEQGFWTTKARFVDRKTAAQIAYEAGQINEQSSMLISEDLIAKDRNYFKEGNMIPRRVILKQKLLEN